MDAISSRLLFKIGTTGFCLSLSELVEICEKVTERIDYEQRDQQLSVVGALPFRKTMIPVVDLVGRLALDTALLDTALVLNSSEGNWALLVGQVEGFYSESDLVDCALPRLLCADGWRCFNRIALLGEAPFIQLDLPSCYAGGQK